MAAVRRGVLLGLAILTLVFAGYAVARTAFDVGRIGPKSKIQPSGRKLRPVGKLTKVGNHPAGGALTRNGFFYWTVSAGRGRNGVRIVQAASRIKCKKPRRPGRVRRASHRKKVRYKRKLKRYKRKRKRYRRCVKRRRKRIGRVVQTIPLPGASGGIAMSPDGHTVYVSGLQESEHKDQQSPAGTPGQEGDVLHVFSYNGRTGRAARAGIIPVPPPSFAPIPQDFPPRTSPKKQSWPQQIAISRDGKRLLVALDLADGAAIV